MIYLLIVSLIWAFSFGLIKGSLTGIDPNLVAFLRLFLSLLVFLPFLRFRNLPQKKIIHLIIIGSIQYGLMYTFYLASYGFLAAYEVAVFTIFTPFYMSLTNDLFEKKFNKINLIASIGAIVGTGIIVYREIASEELILGFLLVQISNICFALGQIFYKRVLRNEEVSDLSLFGLLYFGGVVVTGIMAGITTQISTIEISPNQYLVIIYLGIIASGLGFFLWNVGARKANVGSLSVFNNLKIPLAVAVSLIFFGESVDLLKLFIGGGITLGSLYLAEKNG